MSHLLETASRLYLDFLFQGLQQLNISKSEFIEFCLQSNPDSEDAFADLRNSRWSRLQLNDAFFFWQQAQSFTGKRTLGLEVGLNLHPSDYGIMSHIWMNCKNLREGAELTVKYKALMNTLFQASLTQVDHKLSYYDVALPGVNAQQASNFIELDFASIQTLGRFLCELHAKEDILFEEIHFKHSPNADISTYVDAFGCKVKFKQKQNRIICRNDILDLPVHNPNKMLKESMLKMLDRIVSIELGNQKLSSRVLAYIENELERGIPEASSAAKHFGSSLSTFKRKLQSENTSYIELCNQVRKKLAAKQLRQAHLSISEIAFQLGFANVSAFHRAFKRWFDQTPKEYRQQNLQE